MKRALISNPPYNMKWEAPPFAQIQPRFSGIGITPPNSNANYAFILTGFKKNERCVFLLPTGVLNGGTSEEKKWRAWLIEQNLIDAVIINPGSMFESTSIGTCILILDKNKTTSTLEMVDLRKEYSEEIREQNGQYGGNPYEGRIYKKTIKVISEDTMQKVVHAIQERACIDGFCKAVPIKAIADNQYSLLPSAYIDQPQIEGQHRNYADIVKDLNYIIKNKNACKLTMNESLAKGIGFDIELFTKGQAESKELNELLKKVGADAIEREDFFTVSKNKNEIKFENNSKEILSSILQIILQTWKQQIFFLNQEENRYLAELRDSLIQDLMSDKIQV